MCLRREHHEQWELVSQAALVAGAGAGAGVGGGTHGDGFGPPCDCTVETQIGTWHVLTQAVAALVLAVAGHRGGADDDEGGACKAVGIHRGVDGRVDVGVVAAHCHLGQGRGVAVKGSSSNRDDIRRPR